MTTFLQYLPYLFKAAQSIPQVVDYVQKMKETYQWRGEWTPEADAAFAAELEQLKTNPPAHWKPEQ